MSPSRSDGDELELAGLLLSRITYGEADYIVHVFTDSLGKIAALARGARKSQKRFGGALEPLHTLALRVSARPHGELFTLKEARLTRPRLVLTQSLSAMETAGRALGWVRKAAPPHTPEPLVWDALGRLLDELEQPEHDDADSLLVGFGVDLLEGLGWGLELLRCVSCNKPCPTGRPAWINPERGGLVCRSCGGGPVLLPGQLRTLLLERAERAREGETGTSLQLGEHSALGLKLIERAVLAHMGSCSRMVGAVSETARAEEKKITKRAGVVALGTLFSRVLGLVRDSVLAALFTRAATDAFMVAFQLPNLLRQLLAEGAVQNAVLPVLTKIQVQEGDDEAKKYFRAVRGLSLSILVVVSVLGACFAPQLVDLFAPGFRARPEQFALTVSLTGWLFPYIFFMGTAALGVAALNTHGRFVATSFSPALLNVSFIVFALALPGVLGAHGYPTVMAMAVGALVGGVLQMVAQWPSLKAIGYMGLPSLAWKHPGVRESLRRMAPTLFGIGVYYIDVIVGRRLLSELGEGPISYFGFALRVCDFPQGIFIMALQAATLPSLAGFVARRDFDAVGRTFAFSMRLALFVGVAATVLFVVLAEPIVSLLFQRGAFDGVATHETARALMAQGLSIFLVAGIRQLVAVFFALGDTRTPVIVASMDLLVFIGLALGLRGPLGHVGVGLAVSGAGLAQFALLCFFLRRRLPQLYAGEIVRSGLKTLAAAAAAGAAAWLVLRVVGIGTGSGPFLRLLPALLGSLSFVVVFLGAAKLLKSAELEAVAGPLTARLLRRRA